MSEALTKEQRAALPDSDFAVPGKRKLPIKDERHTRLAWDMVDRTQGLSDDDRTEARKRILDRARELGIDTTKWTAVKAMAWRVDAMALDMPEVADHPNRMPFSGVLTKIGEPSNAAPHGSGGKRVLMTHEAAEAALPSLLGMAVDYTPDFDGHDPQRKIGVITGADIDGPDLRIEGFIYAADFPEEAADIKRNKGALGFSFEAQQILVADLDADPLVITSCVFTGAAILKKDKAAYTTTSLAASAVTEPAPGDIDMTKEELAEMLAAALKPIADKVNALESTVNAAAETEAKVRPHSQALRSCAEAMKASAIGLHATQGHVAVLNRMADGMDSEAAAGKIPHIYRDHDYAPDFYAGADKPNADVEKLRKELANVQTKLTDAIAAGRADSPAPERKTLSPQVTALLSKAGLSMPGEGMKLAASAVDASLRTANLSIQQRMQVKNELARQGLID
jgi:phage shock protein A